MNEQQGEKIKHYLELEHKNGKTEKVVIESDLEFSVLEKVIEKTHTVRVD